VVRWSFLPLQFIVASSLAAQSSGEITARLAPQFHSYSIDAPSNTTIREFSIPLFVVVPVTRELTVDVGTAYARSHVEQTTFGKTTTSDIAGLTDTQLRADAFVTNVQTTQTEGGGANDQQALDQLFTLEKNIVLRLLADMGVTLTTVERNSIEQRPTRSLAAFLSYSRGLELEDEGRFDAASRLFDNAVRLDPSFSAAQQGSQNAKNAAAGARVSVKSVQSSLRGTNEGALVAAATQSSATNPADGQAFAIADGLNPSIAASATGGPTATSTQPQKDPSSGTGGDNVSTKTATVTIVIHHP